MRKVVWQRVIVAVCMILCLLFAFAACFDTDTPTTSTNTSSGTDNGALSGGENADQTNAEDGEDAGETGNDSLTPKENDTSTDNSGGSEAGGGEGVDADEYLQYLYDTDRLAYYQYAAAARLFDLLSVDMFDLTAADDEGRYPYTSVDESVQGDFALLAHGAENAAQIRICSNGKAEVSGAFGEVTFTLYGTYNKEIDVVTVSGETFALSEDTKKAAQLLYFLPVGDTVYLLTLRPEQSSVVIDEEKDALLLRLSACAEKASTSGDAPEDERELLAESGCYAFLQSVGGAAEVTGTPVISAEGEQYTVIFHEMTSDEYAAAMRLWRDVGNTVYMDSGTQIEFTREIEGKGYHFNVTAEGTSEPHTMTVQVQGAYAS